MFVDTFLQENVAEDIALYCQRHFGEAIQIKEIEHPKIITLLAQEDDQIVAYTQLR